MTDHRANGGATPASSLEPAAATLLVQARRLIAEGRHQEASALVCSLCERYPDRPEVLSAAGIAAFHARDPQVALALLQRAAAQMPGSGVAQRVLAEVLQALGRLEDAENAYLRATELSPEDLHSRFGLAVIRERLGKVTEAEADYRRCLELEPGLAPALLGVGNALRGQGRLDEAGDAYREALAADVSLVAAWHNRGGLMQERGDLDAAAEA